MEIVRHSAPILQKISQIDGVAQKAAVMIEEVKCENRIPALTDHATYPTVFSLTRQVGTGTVKLYLVMLLEETVRALSIAKEPTKEQLLEIAGELIKDHPTLKLEDFKQFFLNYRKGRYGKDYSRFDMTTIYRALEGDETTEGYLSERAELLEAELGRQRINPHHAEGSDNPVSGSYDIDELIKQHIKPRVIITASQLRDRYRRKASEQYAAEYSQWLTDNDREHSEDSVIDFAGVQVFNSDYIDRFIKTNYPHEAGNVIE